MITMTASSILSPQPGTESTRLGADFVVLDPQGRTLRGLNATAARVFELLDGRRDVTAIAGQIAGEYQIAAERALADVLGFLQLLSTRGLLREHGAREGAAR